MTMKKMLLLCVFSALLGGVVSFGWRCGNPAGAQTALPPTSPYDSLTPEERVNVYVYQQANRGVVNINTRGVSGDRFLMFEVVSEGEGSGSIIDQQGHILTNYHVIEGAKEIHVTLFDGNTYDARLVGGDPDTDVAVLKIDAPADVLFPVVMGNSTNLMVGQRVYAIGNPFGLERTLSTGIVSSLDRSIPGRHGRRSLRSIIQVDAAINPGSSGGPLLDTQARMIGMNTAIASRSGESVGVGFAIPVNTISRIVPQLIQNGRVRRPDSGIAKVYQTERGLLISSLVPGGAAEKAGLLGPRVEQKRQGPFLYQTVDRGAADLIVAVDGKPTKTADDFLGAIESHQPGEQVVITVIRGGQPKQIPLKLSAME